MLKIGLNISPDPRADNEVESIVARARAAAEVGLPTVWCPQGYGWDTLTALAVVAREVPGIELGASVLPVQPRHPMVLGAQAQTVQAASGGRLILGLGVSHPGLLEPYGIPFEKPVARLREHLAVLGPILRQETTEVAVTTKMSLGVSTAVRGAEPPVPVILGALGDQMLALAGEQTDGTITFLVGPRTIGDHIVPRVNEAAARAGRSAPRVIVGLPVSVTAEPERVRADLATELAGMASLPSYRKMLAREGVINPGGLALVGDEETVAAGLARLTALGATDLNATLAGDPADQRRTLAFLAT